MVSPICAVIGLSMLHGKLDNEPTFRRLFHVAGNVTDLSRIQALRRYFLRKHDPEFGDFVLFPGVAGCNFVAYIIVNSNLSTPLKFNHLFEEHHPGH